MRHPLISTDTLPRPRTDAWLKAAAKVSFLMFRATSAIIASSSIGLNNRFNSTQA